MGDQACDLRFVLDQLLSETTELLPNFDAERVGIGGLSLGAMTTYELLFVSPCGQRLAVKAGMSLGGRDITPRQLGRPQLPIFIAHGDNDSVHDLELAQDAFEARAGHAWLLTLADGTHAAPFQDDPSEHNEIVSDATTLFWRFALLDDADAREDLASAAAANPRVTLQSPT